MAKKNKTAQEALDELRALVERRRQKGETNSPAVKALEKFITTGSTEGMDPKVASYVNTTVAGALTGTPYEGNTAGFSEYVAQVNQPQQRQQGEPRLRAGFQPGETGMTPVAGGKGLPQPRMSPQEGLGSEPVAATGGVQATPGGGATPTDPYQAIREKIRQMAGQAGAAGAQGIQDNRSGVAAQGAAAGAAAAAAAATSGAGGGRGGAPTPPGGLGSTAYGDTLLDNPDMLLDEALRRRGYDMNSPSVFSQAIGSRLKPYADLEAEFAGWLDEGGNPTAVNTPAWAQQAQGRLGGYLQPGQDFYGQQQARYSGLLQNPDFRSMLGGMGTDQQVQQALGNVQAGTFGGANAMVGQSLSDQTKRLMMQYQRENLEKVRQGLPPAGSLWEWLQTQPPELINRLFPGMR